MWNTIIATAVAASIALSLVNLAAEMSKIQDARQASLGVPQDRGIAAEPIPATRTERSKASEPGA